MVKVVEVAGPEILTRQPPSEPFYEVVAVDLEADGYDITEIIDIIIGRKPSKEEQMKQDG